MTDHGLCAPELFLQEEAAVLAEEQAAALAEEQSKGSAGAESEAPEEPGDDYSKGRRARQQMVDNSRSDEYKKEQQAFEVEMKLKRDQADELRAFKSREKAAMAALKDSLHKICNKCIDEMAQGGWLGPLIRECAHKELGDGFQHEPGPERPKVKGFAPVQGGAWTDGVGGNAGGAEWGVGAAGRGQPASLEEAVGAQAVHIQTMAEEAKQKEAAATETGVEINLLRQSNAELKHEIEKLRAKKENEDQIVRGIQKELDIAARSLAEHDMKLAAAVEEHDATRWHLHREGLANQVFRWINSRCFI